MQVCKASSLALNDMAASLATNVAAAAAQSALGNAAWQHRLFWSITRDEGCASATEMSPHKHVMYACVL